MSLRTACINIVICLTASFAFAQEAAENSGGEILVKDKKAATGTVSIIDGSEVKDSTKTDAVNLIAEKVPSFYTGNNRVMGFGLSNSGAANMTIRGIGLPSAGSSTGLPILVNGLEAGMALNGHQVADIFSMKNIDRIEVLHGPQPVLYGSGAVGGLVNIITKRRTADGFNTELSGSYGSWNTTEDYIMHYGKLGAFDYGVNYDFRYTGGAREQRGPTGYEFDSKYLSHNGTLHTGYQFNKNWYAALDGYIMKMDIHDPGAVGAPNLNNIEYFDVTRGGTSLSISNNYDKLDGSLQIYGNWGKHDANRPASNVDTYDSFDRIFGAKLKETLSLDSGTNLTGGAEYKNYGGRAKTKAPSPPGPADGIYVDNEYIQETSLYGLAEQSLFNNLLLLSAGARWTYSDEHGNYGAWQAGAIVNPAERTKLRFHSARGFKMPDISQTYNKMFGPIHPSSETGIDLKPETYTSFEAGIEQGITDILTASLTGYRIYSKNKFIMSPYSGGGTAWYNNSDSFNYNGLEAGVDLKPVKILTLTAGYSYIDNEQKNTRLSYTPKHRIIGGVKLELLGFMLNVNGEYVKDIFSNTTDKFDNYFVLNAKIAYTFLENYRVFADFNNITDKEYEAYRYYPSSSSIGYDYPMPGFNWRAGASVSL